MSKVDVRRSLSEHLKARRLRETAAKSEDKYKVLLKDFLLEQGEVEDPENGSYWYRFNDDDFTDEQGEVISAIKAERRCPTNFDEDAAWALIEAAGIEDEVVVVETIKTINEDALLALAFAGKISDDAVSALYVPGKETFAFKVVRG